MMTLHHHSRYTPASASKRLLSVTFYLLCFWGLNTPVNATFDLYPGIRSESTEKGGEGTGGNEPTTRAAATSTTTSIANKTPPQATPSSSHRAKSLVKELVTSRKTTATAAAPISPKVNQVEGKKVEEKGQEEDLKSIGEEQEEERKEVNERMSLEFFDQILHTTADQEFDNDDDIFHETLDFEWSLLQRNPSKPAPYVICTAYSKGQELTQLLKKDLPEKRFHTIHAARSNDIMCFMAHAPYSYAKHLQQAKASKEEKKVVKYIEPLPANLKISPGFINYSSQQVQGGLLGGSSSLHLKFAHLQHEQGINTPAPTPSPTMAPRELLNGGPELILTFSPGSKVGKHLRFLTTKWRKILPKLGRLSPGGFHERFFWTAMGSNSDGRQDDGQDDGQGNSIHPTNKDKSFSAHYAHRISAWNSTLTRLRDVYANNRSCGFERVRFLDETDTHVVVSGLYDGMEGGGIDVEDDRHACLVGFLAFLASNQDILSIQMRAKYTSFNAQAAWIIQSGDRIKETTPLWDLGLTGKDELIGVSDTGLDDESCFFYDSKRGRVPRSPWDRPITDMDQRKVVQYIDFVDGGDFVEGHGTHVSASIAGILENRWKMHHCPVGETLACTGACLSQDECSIAQFNYHTCHDWKRDGACDTWFSCPMHGCDGGDCPMSTCGEDPEEALRLNIGMAKDAKIAFFDIADRFGNLSTPSDFNRMLFPPSYKAGARIHSNSWGINIGGYLFDDMKVDQYAYEHQDFLIIYAAGNYGLAGFHSIGSPGTTKNALTIGATEGGPKRMSENMDYVAKFSSRGPTYDGRLKPDVVAPGSYIYSARSSGYNNGGTCAYVAMAGTSMAAPIVAGIAALLRQYFKEGFYAKELEARGTCGAPYDCRSLEPSAPLLKALFVNSAVPVKALRIDQTLIPLFEPPDLVQGHGRIKIDSVIDFYGNFSLFLADQHSLSSQESRAYYFLVDNSTAPLQVSLAWIDPPNSYNARKQLLHDLDLHVTCPEGHRFYPNGLPGPDEKNNVEKVVIYDPTPGMYMITVTAGVLTEADNQTYALVATGQGAAYGGATALTMMEEMKHKRKKKEAGRGAADEGGAALTMMQEMKEEKNKANRGGERPTIQQQAEQMVYHKGQTYEEDDLGDGLLSSSPSSAATATARFATRNHPPSSATTAAAPATRHKDEAAGTEVARDDEEANEGIPLEHMLHPCYHDCLQKALTTISRQRRRERRRRRMMQEAASSRSKEEEEEMMDNSVTTRESKKDSQHQQVCQQLSAILLNCSASSTPFSSSASNNASIMLNLPTCPSSAILETKELCLGYGCEFAACGVSSDSEGDHIKRFKVQSRIILRGVSLESFTNSTNDLTAPLLSAIAIWLDIDPSDIRLMHVNGYKLGESDEATRVPARSMFASRMLDVYGVELGINIYAGNRRACNKLKSSIATTYGHLTNHLHATRSKILKSSLVFDVHSYVVSYRLLPGGIAYGLEKDDEEGAHGGDSEGDSQHSSRGSYFSYLFGLSSSLPWSLQQRDVTVLSVVLLPLLILVVLYWRAICWNSGGSISSNGSGSTSSKWGIGGNGRSGFLRIHRKSWGGEKVEFIAEELKWERNRAITDEQHEYLNGDSSGSASDRSSSSTSTFASAAAGSHSRHSPVDDEGVG